MIIVGFLSWWYTAGWQQAILKSKARLVGVFDFFSIDLLLRTFFSPFRQISAGKVDGPLPVQLRAFFDRLLSRVIGAIVRGIVMIAGTIVLLISVTLSLIWIAGWLVLPAVPIIGLTLALSGWVPWHL